MNVPALQTIKKLALHYGDDAIVRESQWLADRASNADLTVLVAGQFKRGKSTFINALVGEELLPSGVLPLTSVATTIRYGSSPNATVSFLDGGSMHILQSDLEQYVTEAENPNNRLRVASVDVQVPVTALEGLRIVDTPGIASTFLHNTKTARDALREADVAILVVGPEPPIGEAEILFAKEVHEASERLFVVYNKADVLPEQERELVNFTKSQLENALGFVPRLFAISARVALRAAKSGDEDPRFQKFLAEFWSFVANNRNAVVERSLMRKCAALSKRLEVMLRLRRHALLLPLDERRTAKDRFEKLSREIRARVDDLRLQIREAMRSGGRRIDAQLEELLTASVPTLLAELSHGVENGDLQSFERTLERAVSTAGASWLHSVSEVIDGHMRGQSEVLFARIADLENEVLQRGLDVVKLGDAVPPSELEAFDLPGISLPKERIVDTGLEIVVISALRMLPRAARVRILRRQLPEAVRDRLDVRRGRLRYLAHRELDRLANELSAAAERRLLAAEAAVRRALEDAASIDDTEVRAHAAVLERDERMASMLFTHEP